MSFAREPKMGIRHLVVCVQIEHQAFELRHLAFRRRLDPSEPVDGANALRYVFQLRLGHQIRLVDENDVGVANLHMGRRQQGPVALASLAGRAVTHTLIEALQHIFGVDQRDDAIQENAAAQPLVEPENGRNVAWVSQAGGFEQDVVEQAGLLHEVLHSGDAHVLDRTADAAIGEGHKGRGGGRGRVGIGDGELFFNVNRWCDVSIVEARGACGGEPTVAKFVEDDGDFLAVLFAKDVVEQRRFTGPQVAGHDGNGYFGRRGGVRWIWEGRGC